MAQRQFRSDDTSVWPDKYGNGSDGAYAPSTGTDAPIDSACTGTINTNSLSATNASFSAGQLILIHQTKGTGAGQWEFNKIAGYTAGTITTSYPLIYGYVSGAQVIVLKQYTSALIDAGVTLTAKAWNGTVGGVVGWFCTGTTTITGTLTAVGKGFVGGAGPGTSSDGIQGESALGSGATSTNANGTGGGGGRNSGTAPYSGGGGGGGHESPGNNGGLGNLSPAASGGGTSGVAGLTTMTFGGAGGSGGRASANPNGAGGSGGGIIFIISKLITVTGSVLSNGADGYTAVDSGNGGAGGGAGGSTLLKGQVISLGSSLATSSGGAGGGRVDGGAGGGGSVGRIHADYSSTITGTTTPTIDTRQDLALRSGNMFMVFD